MTRYRLTHPLGHWLHDEHPAGTIVTGRPYPADNDYTEITLPDGIRLTVSSLDIELLLEDVEGV